MNSEILIPTHPTMFGYAQKTLPVRYAGGPLLQAGPPAGFEQFAGTSPERPQVIARFTGGEAGVLSGLMRNPDQIRNRPMVVDAPSGKGRVIMFANNPIYRWQTFGEHAMVFNSLLFWNDMPAPAPAAKAGDDRWTVIGGRAGPGGPARYFGSCFARPCFRISLTASFTTSVTTFCAVLRILRFAQARPHQACSSAR